MFELVVRELYFYTPDLFEISLVREDYGFETGECAVLFNEAGDSRPYSMSSAPEHEDLRFLIRKLSGGALSEWLAKRIPGDTVRLSPPFGEFRPAFGNAPVVLAATGVGISPFLSLIRNKGLGPSPATGDSRGAIPPVRPVCLYGVRFANEAVELDLLKQNTALQLAVSREPETAWFQGRITGLIDTLCLSEQTNFYLCGCDAMVNEISDRLGTLGVKSARIHTEVFFD
jgi:ferredoxin-NADP reductase